ncbi:MAG: sigma 54-interacting transcriptional regulator [Desulfamplus sp.]|nr:sigma 54-interacting transcriptional regulator [Desulfamplus sp.]
MLLDEKDFFREATLKICGSLEIERALHQCLLYICKYIPAGQMGFHVYHRDAGIVETVAYATLEGGKTMSIKIRLKQEGRMQVEKQRSVRVRVIDRLGDDPVAGPVANRLNASDLSAVVLDLVLDRTMLGVFSVFNNGNEKFSQEHVHLLSLLSKPCAIALTNSLRYRELKNLKELLADDNRYLQEELNKISGEKVIGAHKGLKDVMSMVRQVSPLESPVLLLGETGTGKEVIANAIYQSSLRKDSPFIKVNCGAIPATLLDSELFGYEKGAFTGALCRKRGRIERAQGGTLFLDEIGELSADAQIRLLRVLQSKEIDRLGGDETIKINIRIIAATHRNLEDMMRFKKFRADLFFRLRVFPITIPPLRARKEDIPDLVHHFIIKKAHEMKRAVIPSPSPDAMGRLMEYHWPGNIRELENAVERSLILDQGEHLFFKEIGAFESMMPEFCDLADNENQKETLCLDEVISNHIKKSLAMCNGRVEGEKGAARLLKINPSTLRKRMKKLGISFGRKIGNSLDDACNEPKKWR